MPVQIDYEQLTKVTQQDLDEGVWDAEHKKTQGQYLFHSCSKKGITDAIRTGGSHPM